MPDTNHRTYAVLRHTDGIEHPEHVRSVSHPVLAASSVAGPYPNLATTHVRQIVETLDVGGYARLPKCADGRTHYTIERES